MKLILPKYFYSFACKGSSCTDNCCVGWEIDIDGKTLEKYRKIQGHMGKRLQSNISLDQPAHFIMKGERCPFLNGDNLCDIILCMGEGYLCDICREHPRYYITLGESIFGGVGLVCEAAAELILTHNSLDHIRCDCDGELDMCDGELLEIYMDLSREISKVFSGDMQSIVYTKSAVSSLVSLAQAKADGVDITPCEIKEISHKQLVETVEKCELLSTELLTLMKNKKSGTSNEADINNYLHNLFSYFLNRYLPKAVEDGDFLGKLKVVQFSLAALEHLFCSCEQLTMDKAVYLSKLYSKEIEYNEDNIALIEDTDFKE